MPILLQDKNRDYRRYDHTTSEALQLRGAGLTAVQSSNVSAIGMFGDDLVIRFHNGSLYQYDGNAKLFAPLLASNSKGKFVWRRIRNTGIPYRKIGSLPLSNDIDMDDDAVFTKIDERFGGLINRDTVDVSFMAEVASIGFEELIGRMSFYSNIVI